MIDRLLPIWQDVLRRNDLSITDNFFELGGDAQSATRMFQEIALAGLGDYSPVVLYRGPTIQMLAEVLSGSKPVSFSGALPLRRGEHGRFLFFTHGLGGNVMEFAGVVGLLDVPHSMYGLQARGSDGCAAPCETVEEMAEDYLQHVRKIQPEGSYYLIGYSHGGLVMLELARLLRKAGDRVAILVMIDSFLRLQDVPLGPRMRVYYRAIQRRWSGTFGTNDGYDSKPGDTEKSTSTFSLVNRATVAVRGASERSLARYRPSYYQGQISFVRAQLSVNFPDDPTAVWARWADKFELTTVPGDHHSVLTDYAKELGAALKLYIGRSPAGA